MSQLCEKVVRAGAMGFTTSRTFVHRSSRGEQIGTLKASADEVLGIAAALQRVGIGVVQLILTLTSPPTTSSSRQEIELLGRIAAEVGRPLSFTSSRTTRHPTASGNCSPRSVRGKRREHVKAQVAAPRSGCSSGYKRR